MNTIVQVLPWIQVVLSLLLIFLVIIQRATEGMEGALGGTAIANVTYFARRGAEKFIFVATIIVAILFAVSAVIPLALR